MKSPVELKAGKINFKLNEACIDLQIFGTLIMLTVYVGSVKENYYYYYYYISMTKYLYTYIR